MPKVTKQPASLRIEELFLVSSSFSHRADFLTVDRRKPLDDHEVDAAFQLLHGLAPSVIGVTVRVATKPGAASAYIFHAEMMAIIRVDDGQESNPPHAQLLHAGVSMLFPFVREMIANVTMRGRFGAMWIKPINVQAAIENMRGLPVASSSEARSQPKRRPKRKLASGRG